MAIHFFSEDTDFTLANPIGTVDWINKVLNHENVEVENLNYIFCSDAHLLVINNQYLKHNFLTDIITFNNAEASDMLEADIFISVDRVRENANQLNVQFHNELDRVLIHGVLHLLGYSDKTEIEISEMRKKEDASLSLR